MRGRKRKDEAGAPSGAVATPFFARFLEDQNADDDTEAEVTTRRERAPFTYKERSAAKTKATKKTTKKASKSATSKSATSKAAASKLMTLKYPSDRDEYALYPYHVEAAKVKGGTNLQTLKYPSDRDEADPYLAVYADAADVPKTASAKPKKNARVLLTTATADEDRVS